MLVFKLCENSSQKKVCLVIVFVYFKANFIIFFFVCNQPAIYICLYLCLCVQSQCLPLSLCTMDLPYKSLSLSLYTIMMTTFVFLPTIKVPLFVFLYNQTVFIVVYLVPDVTSNFSFPTLKDEKLPNNHQKKILNYFNFIALEGS